MIEDVFVRPPGELAEDKDIIQAMNSVRIV